MTDKSKVLNLYKSLLRESKKFASYNFRNYAVRRVRDAFRENQSLTDPNQIKERFAFALENLEIIKRQALISQMYRTDKLIIENIVKS